MSYFKENYGLRSA